MDKREAKIILLEAALEQSYHTIEFLHGCLTKDGYSYGYPDQTESHLRDIENLIEISDGCYHSSINEDCEKCMHSHNRRMKIQEAKTALDFVT